MLVALRSPATPHDILERCWVSSRFSEKDLPHLLHFCGPNVCLFACLRRFPWKVNCLPQSLHSNFPIAPCVLLLCTATDALQQHTQPPLAVFPQGCSTLTHSLCAAFLPGWCGLSLPHKEGSAASFFWVVVHNCHTNPSAVLRHKQYSACKGPACDSKALSLCGLWAECRPHAGFPASSAPPVLLWAAGNLKHQHH
ncbi:hypothetical protein GWK47_021198 [Chionoecetes opilio]|uniref:Uncharacterized protein n=1 Tax=Chionoecetes opilio TaxID=41210 RepID=A0A8J4XPP9_CHIOP|nr:hypothetical protein GWK47_021198 [Chionoecetes opilio]